MHARERDRRRHRRAPVEQPILSRHRRCDILVRPRTGCNWCSTSQSPRLLNPGKQQRSLVPSLGEFQNRADRCAAGASRHARANCRPRKAPECDSWHRSLRCRQSWSGSLVMRESGTRTDRRSSHLTRASDLAAHLIARTCNRSTHVNDRARPPEHKARSDEP
jgi:hypothetical protein